MEEEEERLRNRGVLCEEEEEKRRSRPCTGKLISREAEQRRSDSCERRSGWKDRRR